MPLISIIVRTKDEERWIGACLRKIKEQTISDLEVILVDSGSSDKTIARAKAVLEDIRLAELKSFLPGHALNEGIRASNGQYIVCVSSHCIPKRNDWLEVMLANFTANSMLAGVYGRQIPMHFTNNHDKRDLIVTFGLDRRVQHKDPFFHNANSMIPRSIWNKFPFDETVTNIEDRLWASKVLAAGYHIIYEPDAPVYHHHGIYQNRDEKRLSSVIRILGDDPGKTLNDNDNPFTQTSTNIAAIITVREEPSFDQRIQTRLLEVTIKDAKEATSVKRVVVTTNSERLASAASAFGAEVPFIRPDSLAEKGVPVVEVLRNTLEWYESNNVFFDYVVILEITHPFRPPGIVQKCIAKALETGLESVVAGIPEFRPCWWFEGNEYHRVDDYLHRRSEREPIHIGLPAICSVITPGLIRKGKRIADRVGIVEIDNPLSQLEVRTNDDFEALKQLLNVTQLGRFNGSSMGNRKRYHCRRFGGKYEKRDIL